MADIEILTFGADSNAGTAKLSVLIPYYKDNPNELLSSLCAQSRQCGDVEILLYDDGTANAQINAALKVAAQKAGIAVTLMLARINKGRSAARNALQSQARADWVLFLDADMMPETPDFLQTYLNVIEADDADVIFGGFTMPDAVSSDTALHRAFSQVSDCLNADERMAKGPQYVCSSNLCVKRAVLTAQPFDTRFTGWGWEDSEWAARVASEYRLLHIDNPARHLGLENTQTMLNRFRDSATNYSLFTQKHPDLARKLTLYKTMKTMRMIPGQKLARPVLSALVHNNITIVPMRLRVLALKIWRASWYAERCQS